MLSQTCALSCRWMILHIPTLNKSLLSVENNEWFYTHLQWLKVYWVLKTMCDVYHSAGYDYYYILTQAM